MLRSQLVVGVSKQTLYLLSSNGPTRERTAVIATDALALSIRPRPRSAASTSAGGPSVVISMQQRGGADDPVLDSSARRLGRVYGTLGLLHLGPGKSLCRVAWQLRPARKALLARRTRMTLTRHQTSSWR